LRGIDGRDRYPHAHAAVEFQAPPARVRELIPASYGTLTATPGGTLFEGRHGERTVMRVLSVFPGSRVTAFEKNPPGEPAKEGSPA